MYLVFSMILGVKNWFARLLLCSSFGFLFLKAVNQMSNRKISKIYNS